MKAPTTREERAARDADFAQRLEPRMVWPSQQQGTYRRKPMRVGYSGQCDPVLAKAREKALRRRQNRAKRGWLPHAQR